MRKLFGGILFGLLLIVSFSLALAQKNKEVPEKDAMKCDMMSKDMLSDMRMMRPMMMANNMVATSDGGFVVLVGNKLKKYDKNLVLQKEVEIDMDGGMRKAMKMQGKCPISEQMMQEEKGKTKE